MPHYINRINRFPFGILATLLVLTAVVSALAIFAGSDHTSADTLPQPFVTRLESGTPFSDVTCAPTGFELDGDIQVGTVPNVATPPPGDRSNCPGDDWSTINGAASSGGHDAVFIDDTPDIRACGANGNNPNDAVTAFDIGRNPTFPTSAFGCDDIALAAFTDCTTHTQGDKVDDGTYHIVEGGAQPKADIENFYSVIVGTTAYVGFERVATSGDTHLNVAFKQGGAILNQGECLGQDPGRSSGWTVNDLIANVNYSGGTLLPSVSVFRVEALFPADSDGNFPADLCQVTPGALEVDNFCLDPGIQVLALTNCTLFQPHSQVRCDEDNSNIEAGYWLATICDGTQDNPKGNSAGCRETSSLVEPPAPGNNGQPESQRSPRSFIEVSITSTLINPCFANLQVQSRASGESVTSALSDIGEASFPGCKIIIEKRDEATNQLIGGTTFTIEPNPFACLFDFAGDPNILTVTDNDANDQDPTDGIIELSPVCPGAYTVTETVAPDGWSINLIPETCEILVNAGSNECTVTIFDPLGDLTIFKREAGTGQLLAGAEFLIVPHPYWCTSDTKNGTPSPTADVDDSLTVTDNDANDEDPADGVIALGDVCIANYTVTEISAPAGYSLDPGDPQSCVVEEPDQACNVTFNNPLGDLTIFKVDTSGDPLTGAEFSITPNPFACHQPPGADPGTLFDGHPQDASGSATDGIIRLDRVCIAVYTVTETKAPDGFVALTDPLLCTVEEPDQSCEVTFVNQPNEACTPGFWQGGFGSTLWDEFPNDPDWAGDGTNPFAQDQLFNLFFAPHSALDGLTMFDLVSTGGGPIIQRATARFLVAAYLNAVFGVNQGFTPGGLAQAWQDAVTADTDEAFQDLFNILVPSFAPDCPIVP